VIASINSQTKVCATKKGKCSRAGTSTTISAS